MHFEAAPSSRIAPPYPPVQHRPWNREGYDEIIENRFKSASVSPLSTFGLDVDTASYANVRRFLASNRLPPEDAVRIEEMINYFDYDYPEPKGSHPVSITTELGVSPWNPDNRLALIGVRAKSLKKNAPNRLTFLIDTSGSMRSHDKLMLIKHAFDVLINNLGPEDQIAIVAYAGSAGLVLPPTPGNEKFEIRSAINRLQAGGSTAGAQGIQLAYEIAGKQYLEDANNRVILATDGDFNVGQSSDGELVRLIESRRDAGVFLTVLGVGTGNYQDAKMQKLADHGNGTHHYIDNTAEAKRVFSDKLQGSLYTVAKDVKLQIEWNPAVVAQYRLIGYENRMLQAEDFDDDRKDAGEMGAGHTVTALYEIVPAGKGKDQEIEMRYQETRPVSRASDELAWVKLRYKEPKNSKSVKLDQVFANRVASSGKESANIRWASAVAELGLLLRNSPHKARASYGALIHRAESVLDKRGRDTFGEEFVSLARRAQTASRQQGFEGYARR